MTLVKTFVISCDDCGATSSGYPKEAFLNKCRRWGWHLHGGGSGDWHRCPNCIKIFGTTRKEVTP